MPRRKREKDKGLEGKTWSSFPRSGAIVDATLRIIHSPQEGSIVKVKISLSYSFSPTFIFSLSLSIFYPPLNSSISFVLVFYFVQTAITHASRNLNVVSSLLLSNSVLKTHTADRRRRPRIKHRGEWCAGKGRRGNGGSKKSDFSMGLKGEGAKWWGKWGNIYEGGTLLDN